MPHILSVGILVAAFFGAGLFNAAGTAATKMDFVRWGYPSWWCYVTGTLEIAIAGLMVFTVTRGLGLIFGAIVIAVAIATVLRRREFSHLAPLGLFVALLALVVLTH